MFHTKPTFVALAQKTPFRVCLRERRVTEIFSARLRFHALLPISGGAPKQLTVARPQHRSSNILHIDIIGYIV